MGIHKRVVLSLHWHKTFISISNTTFRCLRTFFRCTIYDKNRKVPRYFSVFVIDCTPEEGPQGPKRCVRYGYECFVPVKTENHSFVNSHFNRLYNSLQLERLVVWDLDYHIQRIYSGGLNTHTFMRSILINCLLCTCTNTDHNTFSPVYVQYMVIMT